MLVSRCESACFATQNPCFHLLRRTSVRPPTDWHAVKESSHPTCRDAPRRVRKLRTIKRSSALTVSQAPLYCLNTSHLFTCRPILIPSPPLFCLLHMALFSSLLAFPNTPYYIYGISTLFSCFTLTRLPVWKHTIWNWPKAIILQSEIFSVANPL